MRQEELMIKILSGAEYINKHFPHPTQIPTALLLVISDDDFKAIYKGNYIAYGNSNQATKVEERTKELGIK